MRAQDDGRKLKQGHDSSAVLSAWTAALQAHDPDQMLRRLQWDGIAVADAEVFLDFLSRSKPPREFAGIQRWLRGSPPIERSDWTPQESIPFVELWNRIAAGVMVELVQSMPRETAAHYQTERVAWGKYQDVHEDLTSDLVARLAEVGAPAVWAEFNARRTPHQIVIAHLRADEDGVRSPSRTVYCNFVEELRIDGLQWLTRKYPVLRHHLSTLVELWLRASAELLTRLHHDHDELTKSFSLAADAKLAGIRQGLSDPHHGGRTVAALTFTSMSSRSSSTTVVYKPKDLRIDQEFQHLLRTVPSPPSADGPMRTTTVMPCDGYGYMEWVAHDVCTTEPELRSFYRSAGRLTAILYLVGGSDCHHENLIASGDQLVLIDAETLFEGVASGREEDADGTPVRTALYEQIGNSVIRLGLLPQVHYVGRKRTPRDVSALGIEPPRDRVAQGVGWTCINTDGMIAAPVESPTRLPTSLPVGIGSPNRLGDFVEDFCAGFEGQLVVISAEKSWWLQDRGPLAAFKTLRRRFVPRPTWLYVWLRQQLTEPASMESGIRQRLVLESLARSYLLSPERPKDWPLFAAEVAQLQQLDVPFFEQTVDGLDLLSPDGSRVAGFFSITGFENATAKFRGLDPAMIELQLRLIRGMIAAQSSRSAHAVGTDRSPTRASVLDDPTIGERRSAATDIGDFLVDTAIRDGGGTVEWLGLDASEDVERSRYGALGLSLYGGKSGIALFLAALGVNAGSVDLTYRDTARLAFTDLQGLLRGRTTDACYRWWRDQPLGLAGSGGVLLALLHLRGLLPELADEAAHVSATLLDALDVGLLRSDQQLDLIYGCAGLIGPLLKIGTARASLLAQEAGNLLVDRQDAGGGWLVGLTGPAALTGFSHGAAGIAAALARLHAVYGRKSYREAAARALCFERQHFDPTAGNWPDFRGTQGTAKPRFMTSWCHGAPGIALSRLCLSQTSLWDGQVEEELHHALIATCDAAVAGGDSLCCGRLGRAAILRVAASHGPEPRWLAAAIQFEAQSLQVMRTDQSYRFNEVPGLFQGAAGVGLALLESTRERNSRLLPSVLSAGLYERR